jgi:dihydroorotase
VGLGFDLVHQGVIDLERLVALCSTNPARIFGLAERGTFRQGAWGDITILDPNFEWTFDVARSKSKSRNTPFNGRKMKGAAVATIVAGRVVYLHPEFARINERKHGEVSVQ